MVHILVVDDDPKLNKAVCTYLNDCGFAAKGMLNAREAYDELYNSLYDLIVSDIMMPEVDGFAFAQSVRQVNKHIPILFMSAKDDLPSKQKGFRLGIDDYMVKPIELAELEMRVRALLRRANIEAERKLTVGNLTMDADAMTVEIDGEEVPFATREFNILYKLLSYPKKTFTRAQLMDEFWKNVRQKSIFPPSLFFVYLGVLFLMSGIHTGLIVGMNALGWPDWVQVYIPLLYWGAVAVGLTLFTRRKTRKTYEEPMLKLAKATRQVAEGDFSVYVPPIHTPDRTDYLDQMILDFDKMVEELGSIETLKTDFFSDVSHEFKSPLAVISSNAELLQAGKDLTDEEKECVENIRYATKRLSNLIQNMLKLNKLEKQTIRPMPEEFDLCAQLCECAVQFEDAWEKKNLDFEADLEDSALVYADPGLAELVWTNLLSNAIKFTPEGGTVTLTQKSEDDQAKISVKDSGCGMTKETIQHIFDKFYQGDTSHATNGNGLGLALVKRILELSDGSITVESQPEEGSVFTVGIIGTAFMAGSVFVVTAEPMQIVLCVILAVPAFAGWILPYFVYQKMKAAKTRQVTPFIEKKIEEIYEMCEKGQSLL